MKIVKSLFISLILSLSFISSSKATELIFQFTNPAFGGNPLYGSYYLQSAQMQNIFKEKKESWFKSKSLIERFTDSFTSQLLYRMSDYILDQLFGEDNTLPESPMTYTIGNFRIEYNPSGDYYTFTITDLSTGESSTIQVPKFM
ncbi:Curli production assembly/transport component CsgF [Thermodesulfobacterium geofontis OPF15]|jgi:curli production assembly/transport component CsgF|uniref:Curli production assembly/transport component CsgF n=1 Tax=Thermodesulfobacterium geofontis (strain OPF15) TaxID=795359 RepID=F8C5M9_THEGP|nr:curli production assembly/transport component CsgF [Thermodesulfobacterium geofontis]AEH23010.1 Curli production assembly/transport component CsgF [Thermodesulfobacterium geofontis OPF15]